MIDFMRISVTEKFKNKPLGSTYKIRGNTYHLRRLPIKKNQHEERVLFLKDYDNDKNIFEIEDIPFKEMK